MLRRDRVRPDDEPDTVAPDQIVSGNHGIDERVVVVGVGNERDDLVGMRGDYATRNLMFSLRPPDVMTEC